MMNSRQRVAAALGRRPHDRTPVFSTYTPEIERRLRAATGSAETDLGVALGNDLIKDCVGLERSFYYSEEPVYTCPWGIQWRYFHNSTGSYTEIVGPPLAGDEAKLERYQIPDPLEERQYDRVRRLIDQYGATHWIIGSCQISIFEASWYLRGMDQFLRDMLFNPDYANALMDKVMQFPLAAGRRYIELGVDMVWLGDDVSMQDRMLISPELWRAYLKPRYAFLISEFKKLRPGIVVAYHSCGRCEPILNEMIEIGLDVLNPIQPLAMEPAWIKEKYGDRLALFGGMDVQRILPTGTPEEVKAEARRLKRVCGAGGGYILAPAHHMQSDTPLENIRAFYEAALEGEKD